MDNRKYKNLIIMNTILVIVSLALFGLQNFVLNQKEAEYVSVFRAKNDIAVYDELSREMFQEVRVLKSEMLELNNMVTDFEGVYGFAKSNILKGEYLVSGGWVTQNDEADLQYTIEIQPTFSGDLAYGDRIDVFWMSKDNTIGLLFGDKKVYRAKTLQVTNGSLAEATQQIFVKVTKQEMLDYYTKLKTHSFIVLPMEFPTADNSAVNPGVAKEDNEDIFEAKPTMIIETVDGESWETLADSFNTTVDHLYELNPLVQGSELTAGQQVKVPLSLEN